VGSEERTRLAAALAARPCRLGILVPVRYREAHWTHLFEAALAAQTRFWGGSGNLVFPLTEDFDQQEVFWALNERFDPDAFVNYTPTWNELRDISPVPHEAEQRRLRATMTKQGARPEEIEDFLAQVGCERAVEDTPSASQLQLLRTRLATFHYEDPELWQLDPFDGHNDVGWPFTDATNFVEIPRRIMSPDAPQGAARRLLHTTHVGRVSSSLAGRLAERDVEVGRPPASRYLDTIVRERWRDGGARYPWDLADNGTAVYGTGRDHKVPSALVIGDSPWDFALFYALKRMTGTAWWLPSWLARDRRYLLLLAHATEHDSRGRVQTKVVSTSSSEERREAIVGSLNHLSRRSRIEVGDWREVLPEQPNRIYAREDEGRLRKLRVEDGSVLELDTPIPGQVRTEPAVELRWLSEVQSPEWSALRHPAVIGRVLGHSDASAEHNRAGRDGIAYFSTQNFIRVGASLKSVVVRPDLRPLDLLAQLQAILEPLGWQVAPSDKGIYARESMRLLGGFERLCKALREPGFRALTHAYRQEAKATGANGVFLRQDQRRYLPWLDLEAALGPDSKERIDSLLTQGVLTRGLVLKCAVCRQEQWQPIEAVTDSFTCARCGTRQAGRRESWRGADEPQWSYRLAEVLFQLLDNNGELALLAVADEFGRSRRPLGLAFELELRHRDGLEFEFDLACSDGARLVIGEATITGRLSAERFEFLGRLAKATEAQQVLLATSKPGWTPETVARAERAFPGPWPRLRLLSGVKVGPGRASEKDRDGG
jgi:hypothetical protein